jgi:histidinol-phosphatase
VTDPADPELAHRLADQVNGIARRYFSTATIESRAKSDGSPVTDADREIEIVPSLPDPPGVPRRRVCR